MSKFFNPNFIASRNTPTVQALENAQNTTIGVAYGWAATQAPSTRLKSLFARINNDLLVSPHLFTDLRLIQALAHIRSVQWTRSKSYVNDDLDTAEITTIALCCHLFARWTCPAADEMTLAHYIHQLSSVGRALTVAQLTSLDNEAVPALGLMINNNVVDLSQKAALDDLGLTAITWAGPVEVAMNMIRNQQGGAAPNGWNAPAAGFIQADASYAPTAGWDCDAYRGGLNIWRYARTNATKIKKDYGTALMVFVASCVRTGTPTQQWITRRSSGLEQGLGLAPGTLDFSSLLIPAVRELVQFSALGVNELYQALSLLAQHADTLKIPRIQWMVDQAAYTNMTIPVTLVHILNSYSYLPLSLLFTDVTNELGQFIMACVWAYLYPFGGLLKIPYPATKFPNIAAATLDICSSIGMTTFRGYKGNFAGVDLDKKDTITTTFNNIRMDAMAGDQTPHYLSTLMAGMIPTLRSARGVTTVTYQAAAVAVAWPVGWDPALTGMGRNHQAGSFEVDTRALYNLLRVKDQANANLDRSIRDLYQLLALLDVGLQTSPCDGAYSVASFARAVPAQGDLFAYVGRVGAAAFTL